MNIDKVNIAIDVYKKLVPVARQLHIISERQCNGYANTDWGRKQEVRDANKEANLINKAISLADEIGLLVYYQTDPRGVALYLITNEMDSTNYSNGIAIY